MKIPVTLAVLYFNKMAVIYPDNVVVVYFNEMANLLELEN